MDLNLILAIVLIAAAVMIMFGLPIWLVLKGKRAFDRAVRRDLERIYGDINRETAAMGSAPRVTFTYHTYSGELLRVSQVKHRISAPPQVAEKALRDFLWHTLKYGWLTHWAPIIPLLAYGNYLAQMRSVRRQAEGLSNDRASPIQERGSSPSSRRRQLGGRSRLQP